MVASFVEEMGATVVFAWDAWRALWRGGYSFGQVIEQMYAVGVRSLPTTITAGFFVGAIMAIQINLELRDFGAQGFLGGLSTSVTVRNVGPVLIAFILSGKVGAYTSAELGTMRVTEQLDAVRCLGTDPMRFIIVPRMLAVVLSSFILLIVGLTLTIAGGALISSTHLAINVQNYIQNIPRLVSWWSVGTGVVKSFFFGILIAVICCYQGYSARGGAAGVGRTVRRTAVITMVCIIVADYGISNVAGVVREIFEVVSR
jgi:phospholipid/cholesterol/gamma-HCH transport system permease protein